ncbi:MAG: LPS export ABC transporter periplasmic protein LptC [Oceanospirillaceae bacterium]|nr:LPS export ABC transporter periplasmic protein LptC [Oceanospirillaceae bacterium]
MSTARTRLIIAALLLGPVLLYWGLGIAPSERSRPPQALQQGEDYFATDTRTRVFDDKGMLEQTLSTPRLDHYPDRAESELTTPEIILYGTDGSVTTTTAKHGTLPDDRVKALLSGDVRVKDSTSSGVVTQVLTETLTLYPDTKLAETDEPVTILSDNVRYDATGMKASFENKTLKLLSNVQGLHENED